MGEKTPLMDQSISHTKCKECLQKEIRNSAMTSRLYGDLYEYATKIIEEKLAAANAKGKKEDRKDPMSGK